jgi:hypothetical protein
MSTTTEILRHPRTTASVPFHKGLEGAAFAVLAFMPSYTLGFFVAMKLLNSPMEDMAPLAETLCICFAVWSIYLLYDLHRSAGSLKRVLFWGGAIGSTLGFLSYFAVQ